MASTTKISTRGVVIEITDVGIEIRLVGAKKSYSIDWAYLILQLKHEVNSLSIDELKELEGLGALFG